MSHKATNWLSDLPPELLSSSEFRVLFHLCDCHNPSAGCFPTQAYLIERADVSNGTVNNALNSLEAKGLIQRHVSVDERTRRKRPTRYILGFEIEKPQEPSPENGDGKGVENAPGNGPSRLQPGGDGSISNPDPVPSPNDGRFHLQPTGDKPVIEPVNNLRARATGLFGETAVRCAEFWAPNVASGRYVPPSAMSIAAVDAMIAMKLATVEQCRALSLHFTTPRPEQKGDHDDDDRHRRDGSSQTGDEA